MHDLVDALVNVYDVARIDQILLVDDPFENRLRSERYSECRLETRIRRPGGLSSLTGR